MTDPRKLLFSPFSSLIDRTFWHTLRDKKLNEYALDDSVKGIVGSYTNSDAAGVPQRLFINYTAFDDRPEIGALDFKSHGSLQNMNTIEAFREIDKKSLLEGETKLVWEAIVSKKVLEQPSLLSRFLLLTFADLKSYRFHYWFAVPAIGLSSLSLSQPTSLLSSVYSEQQLQTLVESYSANVQPLKEAFFIISQSTAAPSAHRLAHLETYTRDSDLLFAFCDPSTRHDNPGWPLRNYLAFIAHQYVKSGRKTVKVLCFRDRTMQGTRSIGHSLLLSVDLEGISELKACPNSFGWERNAKNVFSPRVVDLSLIMDPTHLAANAVDLNLKLMLWRVQPDLDLSVISNMRCLLLGAGTLGCNVARCLMGWGVRHITLVDNGHVSYSNPVRQSLFTFEDCKRPKAEAAAEAMRRIVPGMDAQGHCLSIPMPGHTVGEGQIGATLEAVDRLEHLFDQHDVIFLLLDSREARWLPTLLGKIKNKVVMNAALGFDNFLVMRHSLSPDHHDNSSDAGGVPVELGAQGGAAMELGAQGGAAMELGAQEYVVHPLPTLGSLKGTDLGCYFCSDIVAPGNSQRDRTLDQQCTVARPGLSFMASALVVELLMSLITHPQRANAPPSTKNDENGEDSSDGDNSSVLGIVPHMIRGVLSQFDVITPCNTAFDKCTACSQSVLKLYKEKRDEFLVRAFNEHLYLEDITGLTDLCNDTLSMEVLDSDFSDE